MQTANGRNNQNTVLFNTVTIFILLGNFEADFRGCISYDLYFIARKNGIVESTTYEAFSYGLYFASTFVWKKNKDVFCKIKMRAVK